MTANSPPSVKDIDLQLQGFHRLRWVLITFVLALVGVVLTVMALTLVSQREQLARQEAEIRSSCDFYRPLTGFVPVPLVNGKPPAKLGVQIGVSSRVAFFGERCAGHIGPPSPQLLHWARYYHIRL